MDWDSLYRDPQMCLEQPAEEVVQFVPLLRERETRRVLDLGFGAGRHIVYLAKLGFEMYGTDISPRGKAITVERLAREGLSAELQMSDMTVVPYEDCFFGGAICRGVITHNVISNIRLCLREIHRSLAVGGLVMVTFISTQSSLYGQGEEVEKNTFIADDGLEKGVPHHFMTEEDVLTETGMFRIIDLQHVTHNGLVNVGVPYTSAHWVFVGERDN